MPTGILGSVGSSIRGLVSGIDASTMAALDSAAGVQEFADAQAQRAQNVAIRSLQEQVSAGDWTSGIKTEKQLLRDGASLAQA